MTDNDNGIFLVQVTRDKSFEAIDPALEKLPSGASPIKGSTVAEALYESISSNDIQAAIENICSAVNSGLSKAKPQSCSIEFHLGFKAGVKVPILMSGEANGGLKITLAWKNEK